MTQIKIIKNPDIDRMEQDVNIWLSRQVNSIEVLDIKTGMLIGNLATRPMHITTITYKLIPSVFHD